jgi:serine protease Do
MLYYDIDMLMKGWFKMDYSDQYDSVKNSVVQVIEFIHNGAKNDLMSFGTGVIIGNGQYVLTCNHCVQNVDGNIYIGVRNENDVDHTVGSIVYSNKVLDIAIIDLKTKFNEPICASDSDNVKVGNETFVVGYHMASPTVSVLSANIAGFYIRNGTNYIKIDSSVNHGNSGGPLFNKRGELIGIVNTKLGTLSNFLDDVEKIKPDGYVNMFGIDPIKTIQQLIREMKTNLNLGIGMAIPINIISSAINQVCKINFI